MSSRNRRGSGVRNRGRKGGNFSGSPNKQQSRAGKGNTSKSSGPGSKTGGSKTGGGGTGGDKGGSKGGGWGSKISKSISNIGTSIKKSFSNVKSSLGKIGSTKPSIGQTKGSFRSGDKNWSSGYKGIGKMTGRDKEMSKTWTGKGWATPGSVQHAHQSGERGWSAFGSSYSETPSKPGIPSSLNAAKLSRIGEITGVPHDTTWSKEFTDKTLQGIGSWLKNTAIDSYNAVREGFSKENFQRLSDQYHAQIGDPEAREQSIKDAVGSWFNPQKNEMALGHQVAQIGKFKFHDVPKSLLSLAPGPQREGILRSLRESQPDHEGLRAFSNLASGVYGIAGGIGMIRGGLPGQGLLTGKAGGLNQLKRITNLGRAERIARMPSAVKASRIGSTTTGLGGWWNKGRNLRVANENVAGWGKLLGDDLAQVGKFPRDIPFKGIGPTQRVFDKGLLGTGLPKNLRQAGQFVTGKGGLTWSGSRGVPTGPTPAVRQAFERPIRGIRDTAVRAGGDLKSLISRPVGAAVGALGVGAGAATLTARGVKGGLDAAVSDKAQLKTLMDFLGSQKVEDFAEWTQGDSWLQKQVASYTGDTLRHLADPAIKYARDLPGFVGIVGKIQAGKLERRSEAGNIPGSLDTLLGSYDLATRYPGQPGIGAELGGRLKQFGQFLNNQDVQSVREILGQRPQRTRRERVRNLRESGYGTSRNNQMRIQSFDPNKINIQADPYGQAQAASDESDLASFWQEQNRLNTAADQRLKDIQSDRSDYTRLIDELNKVSTGYSDELARIQPAGQELSDELARIQPYEKEFADELTRLEPIGKQYTDEIKRLEPYDAMFRDAFRDHYQWRGHTSNNRMAAKRVGSHTPPPKMSGRDFIKMNRSWSQNTGSPHQREFIKDYEEYLTGVENLHKWHKEHQDYLADIQSQQKEYQTYLADIQGQHKEYQTYLGGIKSSQEELGTYQTEVNKRSKQLEDYASAFGSARQASDAAARTYTIRSQQGISGAFRPGVTGIRAARGYATYGSRNRNRSPKKRFNRDFRIGSFGDSARIQPINV